jgi:hypothetical protein
MATAAVRTRKACGLTRQAAATSSAPKSIIGNFRIRSSRLFGGIIAATRVDRQLEISGLIV